MFDICTAAYITDFPLIIVPKFSNITGRRMSLQCDFLRNIMDLKHIFNIVLVLNWFSNNLEVKGL